MGALKYVRSTWSGRQALSQEWGRKPAMRAPTKKPERELAREVAGRYKKAREPGRESGMMREGATAGNHWMEPGRESARNQVRESFIF